MSLRYRGKRMAKSKLDEAVRRRVRAGRLLLAGKNPPEVARLVGAPRQTVYRWRDVLHTAGIDALRRHEPRRAAAVDAQTRPTVDRTRVWRAVQRGARLALARPTGSVQPEARAARLGAQRGD